MAIIPHLAYPLRVGADGSLAVVEQDSAADVSQCVAALLGTVTGTRIELPVYGVPDLTFTTGQELGAVEQAIGTWEPRAAGSQVSMVIGNDGAAQVRVEIPAGRR